MARVQVKSQSWGVFLDRVTGGARGGLTPQAFSGTVYLAKTGNTEIALANWTSDINGELPGYVNPGEYSFTDPDGHVFQVEAVSAASVLSVESSQIIVKEGPINVLNPPAGSTAMVGDDSANDTAALTALLALGTAQGGVELYFPPRHTYLIDNITIPQKQNITLRGSAGGVLKKRANGPMFTTPSGGWGHHLSFLDMALDGNGANFTGEGIVVGGATLAGSTIAGNVGAGGLTLHASSSGNSIGANTWDESVVDNGTNLVAPEASAKDDGQSGMIAPSGPGMLSSAAALVSNQVYVMRFVPDRDILATSIAFAVSVASGTDDPYHVGILNADRTSILAQRTAAVGAVGHKLNATGVKVATLDASYQLTAGTVYYAFFAATSTATLNFQGHVNLQHCRLFGASAPQEMAAVKAASYPLTVPLTGTSTNANGPALALREA